MKVAALISLLLASIALVSCGGDSSGDSEATADAKPAAGEITWKQGEPFVEPNYGLPPKKLIVRDLRQGTGREASKGRTITLRFKNFDYRTAELYEDWWRKTFTTGFGTGESLGAWERGLKGMKVGGRRALIVPPDQAYGDQPVIYVLELIAVR